MQDRLMMPNVFDFWMTMQRSYLDAWTRAMRAGAAARPYGLRELVPYTAPTEQEQQVIAVGEEALDVSTRRVYGAPTKVKRVVREVPVAQPVELHDETIIVERRAPTNETAGDEALVEHEYFMYDSHEVPVVNKQSRVREVVVLRKQRNNRTEVIRDKVRLADVQIEQPDRTLVVLAEDQQKEQVREHKEHRDTEQRQQQHHG